MLAGRGAVATVRAVIADRAWRDAAVVLAFGVTLGVMNYSIYQSFARIPLGVAVTIEFLGPLAVAVASSRRLVDGAWVLLAGGGVALLSEGFGGQPGGWQRPRGIAFALAAATSWAVYILLSRATGQRFTGSAGLTIAIVVAAVVVTPAGGRRGQRGHAEAERAGDQPGRRAAVLGDPLPPGAGGAAPDPGPAVRHLDEPGPAVAALAGLVLLGEALAARQWLAIGCVTVASAGAARGEAGSAESAAGAGSAERAAGAGPAGRGRSAGSRRPARTGAADAGAAAGAGQRPPSRAGRRDASGRAPGYPRSPGA